MRDVSDYSKYFSRHIHTDLSLMKDLTKFLTRLLTENPKHKDSLFVT